MDMNHVRCGPSLSVTLWVRGLFSVSFLHVQGPLGLGRLLSTAVANQSAAVRQAEVERQQGAVLHADGPQRGAVDLDGRDDGGHQTGYGTVINDGSVFLVWTCLLISQERSGWTEENKLPTLSNIERTH